MLTWWMMPVPGGTTRKWSTLLLDPLDEAVALRIAPEVDVEIRFDRVRARVTLDDHRVIDGQHDFGSSDSGGQGRRRARQRRRACRQSPPARAGRSCRAASADWAGTGTSHGGPSRRRYATSGGRAVGRAACDVLEQDAHRVRRSCAASRAAGSGCRFTHAKVSLPTRSDVVTNLGNGLGHGGQRTPSATGCSRVVRTEVDFGDELDRFAEPRRRCLPCARRHRPACRRRASRMLRSWPGINNVPGTSRHRDQMRSIDARAEVRSSAASGSCDRSSARFFAASPVNRMRARPSSSRKSRWPGVWPGAAMAVRPGRNAPSSILRTRLLDASSRT